MPLYQILCITTHLPSYQHIRSLVKQSALHVMNNGGVVRAINSWGTKTLPQRMKRHGPWQSVGDYWTLHFDSSPHSLRSLNAMMRSDPRVLRWTVLKLADTINDLARNGEHIRQPQHVEDVLD